MKKIILLAVVAVSVTMVSCRKELTCECTNTTVFTPAGGGTGSTVSSTTKTTKDKQKKKDFRLTESCYNTTATQTYIYGTFVETAKCEVK
jgi:hypothetical protein